ncbi:MAG: hypothetical protein M1812_000437 [Candelaria pacifica]|nr:MAG: hypothetical protein M1812_000437 [Candelaria pacifica]
MLVPYTYSIIICTAFLMWQVNGNTVESSGFESTLAETSEASPAEPLHPRTFSITSETRAAGLPWPNNLLRYCFENRGTEDALDSIVDAAWSLWRTSGVRTLDKQKINSCETGENNYWPLKIMRNNRRLLKATMGAKPGRGDNIDPANYLKFDETNVGTLGFQDNVINMAHELGHAIGLHHEHQRPDAAQHVKFECKNLEDYEDKKSEGENMPNICSNRQQAASAIFKAFEFIPIPDAGGLYYGDAYDTKSIMHYGTYFASKVPSGIFKKKVLTDLGGHALFQATRPSAGDIARINILYR